MKLRRVIARVAALLVPLLLLLAVFAAYLQPEMAFTFANQLWACF